MLKIVGHRAYKGTHVENTLEAFEQAYKNNVDIIETDLQMTKDGVVVVNHDADTGRIWNEEHIIADTNWATLQLLRCKTNSTLRMLTLADLLDWAVEHPEAKLMLDIKFTNRKIILVKALADMLATKNDLGFWQERIIWGVWLVDWFQYGVETGVFKDFKVIVISLSLSVAKSFIDYSAQLNNPHFKLYGISIHYVASWTGQYVTTLVPLLNKHGVKVFLWTVNNKIDIQYACQIPNIHGIVTDYPANSREFTAQLVEDKTASRLFRPPSWTSLQGLRFYFFIQVYTLFTAILFNKWIHYKIGGWSIAYILFLFLTTIRFL